MPKVKAKKESVHLTLDAGVLREVRAAFPAGSISAAVECAMRLALERSDLAERCRTTEVLARAALILLSLYFADSEEEAERLRRSAVQKALAQMKRLEERRRAREGDQAEEGAEG